MSIHKTKSLSIDPRTELLLLLIANIITFTCVSMLVEVSVIAVIGLLTVLCGYSKSAVKWLAFFCVLLAMQNLIPFMPSFFAVMFSVLVVYARKLMPCLMIGSLIIKMTPVRLLIVTLRKWHAPQKIIIPLAITIRYFPAIKEEYSHIKDAMRLRGITGVVRKFECIYVPLLISAANTAEELSAAAVTRGIENPAPKTCVLDIRFHKQDFICFGIGILLIAAAIIIR